MYIFVQRRCPPPGHNIPPAYYGAFDQAVGQTSMVLASMAKATPISLTGIHPSKDPGIVKSKLSITSRFKRETDDGSGFRGEVLSGLSFLSVSAFTEPF